MDPQHELLPRPLSSTWADTSLLVLLALLVAGPGLGTPDVLVFDELFYVSDAVSHLEVGIGRSFQAHPPLGTWLLAPGIAIGGATPVAWRLVPLLCGLATVALLHRLALRVLPDGAFVRPAAAAAAVLLVVDGSWFVLTRTAMLDGLLTTFILAAVMVASVATDRDERRGSSTVVLLAAGLLGGAATAVKWSGALGLVIVVVEVVRAWGVSWRTSGRLLAVAAVAMSTYAITWVPFALARDDVEVASCPAEAAPCATRGGISGVIDHHRSLVRYHSNVRFDAGYASPPSLWPLSYEPVTLYRVACDVPTRPVPDPFATAGGCPPTAGVGEDALSFTGNPAVWLSYLLLLPVVAAGARRSDRAPLLAATAWALLWLPWLFVARSAFLFYMAPAVPFMALGLAAAVISLPRLPVVRVLLVSLATGAVAATVAAVSIVPAGAVITAWAAGGAIGIGPGTSLLGHGDLGRTRTVLLVGVVAAAVATFVVFRPNWTIG